MSRKGKVDEDIKIQAVEGHLSGKFAVQDGLDITGRQNFSFSLCRMEAKGRDA